MLRSDVKFRKQAVWVMECRLDDAPKPQMKVARSEGKGEKR